jgi:hypothetical protein
VGGAAGLVAVGGEAELVASVVCDTLVDGVGDG